MTPLETIKERKIVAIVRGLEPAYLLQFLPSRRVHESGQHEE